MVRRKYKIRLTVLAILLVLSLTVEFDYQLWKIDNRQTDLAITESGCVEIIYSDDKSFNLEHLLNSRPLLVLVAEAPKRRQRSGRALYIEHLPPSRDRSQNGHWILPLVKLIKGLTSLPCTK